MKTNKFAKMIHKNSHKIVAILVYAILEWILIFLLIFNSLLSNLITKFAKYFGLKPPCILCSRVNFFDHENSCILDDICEAHGTEISKLQRLSEVNNLCNNGDGDLVLFDNGNRISCEDSQNGEEGSVYIMDKLLESADYIDYSDGFICIEMMDDESSILMNGYKAQDEDDEKCTELCVADSSKIEFNEDHGSNDQGSIISEIEIEDESLTTQQLKTTIKAQQKALNALYLELDEERKSAAISTDETMAMITKIQHEKASMQMEALQYQRMMEEQAEYDQEALQLLNNLMIKREKENEQLKKELEIYRSEVSCFETIGKKMILSRGCKSNDESSIDLDSESEDDRDLDEDRLCVIERLKSLETLFGASDGDPMAKKLLSLFNDEFGGENDVLSVEVFD